MRVFRAWVLLVIGWGLAMPVAAQQRLTMETLPRDGWIEEAMGYSELFVAAARLRGALGTRLEKGQDGQLGVEGVIQARLRGALDEETFGRLHSEFVVPLMFALNRNPTRTDQGWQGEHGFAGQHGVGSNDAWGMQWLIEGVFWHAQEASAMGMPMENAPIDLDEERLALTMRPRSGRYALEMGRWDVGIPLSYRYRRQANGGLDNPTDQRNTHEVALGLDGRSMGSGAVAGRFGGVEVAWSRTSVTLASAAAFDGDFYMDRLEVRLADADLVWRGGERLWRFETEVGTGWLWNQPQDTLDHGYFLRLGTSVSRPNYYEFGFALRAASLFLTSDPRAVRNGARVEGYAALSPDWLGVGLAQRSILQQTCSKDAVICYDGDVYTATLLHEAFWPWWGGELGGFYRVHRGPRSFDAFDWSLERDSGRWAHEAGIFWRLLITYAPLNSTRL